MAHSGVRGKGVLKMRMRGKPLGVEHRTGVINTNPILDDILPAECERSLVLMFKSFSNPCECYKKRGGEAGDYLSISPTSGNSGKGIVIMQA